MIFDKLTEFADAFSVASAAGTYVTTNQVDTGSVVRDLGNGEEIYLIVTVDTEIKGATSGTIQYRLVSDSTAALSSPTVHASSPAFATATAGTVAAKTAAGQVAWVVSLPQGIAHEQFLGVDVVIASQTLTTGKINAFLSMDRTIWQAYADAVN